MCSGILPLQTPPQSGPHVFCHYPVLTIGSIMVTRTGLPKYKTCIEATHIQNFYKKSN